jgi:hypothetical protein
MTAKILDDEVLLLSLLLYVDYVPLSQATEKIFSNPYYWSRKLEQLGITPSNPATNLRKLYTYLTLYPTVSQALAKACANDDADIVTELSNWTPDFQALECAIRAKGTNILIELSEVWNSTHQACAVLNHKDLPLESKLTVLSRLDPNQIVECLPTLNAPALFRAIDTLDVTIPTEYFGLYDVPRSLSAYLTHSSPNTSWILSSISRHLNDNLQLLHPYIPNESMSVYITAAVRANNLDALRLLYTVEAAGPALTEAIVRNNLAAVTILSRASTPTHLQVARSQRKYAIYNLLSGK